MYTKTLEWAIQKAQENVDSLRASLRENQSSEAYWAEELEKAKAQLSLSTDYADKACSQLWQAECILEDLKQESSRSGK